MTEAHTFDFARVRKDFPILSTTVKGKPLTYLDNAATSQKPTSVIEAVRHYYQAENANIHRGVHYLSERATDAYENTRAKVADFIGATDPDEVIFVRGATEGINLIAHGFIESELSEGDEILITHMEHHANIVPWQIAAEKTGCILKVVPVLDSGELDMKAFSNLLSNKTRILSIVHVSNALGTLNPVKRMIEEAHAYGIPVLVDGCQSIPHMPIDLGDLRCDFFVFSGHKVFAPTGIGVLWGQRKWLEKLPPYQSGGDMIEQVRFEGTTYKPIPGKFEAGTPHVEGVIGLSAAIDYLNQMDRSGAAKHEHALLLEASRKLSQFDNLKIVGTAQAKESILSFTIEGMHPHDIGTFLDADGVAIRAGHHCTQPLLQRLGMPATARTSFSFYNDFNDIDRLIEALTQMQRFFR